MLDPILEGLFLGLVLSFLTGPIFFLLIDTSIRHGIKSALLLDLGVLISDVVFIAVAFIFYSEFGQLQKHEQLLALIAGGIFIFFGLYTMFRYKNEKAAVDSHLDEMMVNKIKSRSSIKEFLKGFIMNIMNFAVLFYWFSVMILGRVKNGYSDPQLMVYISCILISYFSIDVLKIVGAGQFKGIFTPTTLKKINTITGFIMILFGLAMIVKATGLLGK